MTTNTIKKIVTKLAITLLAITATACSAKSEWVKVIQTETSVHYYLDKSDNEPHDDILYTSMISIYRYPTPLITKDKKEISYKSKNETIMIDCKKKLIVAPDKEYYADTQAQKGTEIYFYVTPPDQLEWLLIESDPVFDALYKKVNNACMTN